MLERYLLDLEGAEMYDFKKSMELGKFQMAYALSGPALEDMLGIRGEAEWLDYIEQEGPELEERPLCLHLAAWHGRCLEIGCFEGDVTRKLAEYLQKHLPEVSLDGLPVVNVDIDELNGGLESQIGPYQERVEALGCKLHVFFDDTYCAGLYFVFLEKPRPR